MKNYNQIYSERFAKLNKKQQEAVLATDGPVMVIAGPGTGKTELLSMRTANILKEGLARPESILCLTFTDVASKNMRDRLLSIIGPEAHKVQIFTFHSFCTNIINKYSEYFFNAVQFDAVGELKQNEILENIFKELEYKNPFSSYHFEKGWTYFKNIKSTISDIKQAGLSAKDFKTKLEKNKLELEILEKILKEYLPENMRSKENKEKFITFIEKIKESETELGDVYFKKMIEIIENGGKEGDARDEIIKKDDNKESHFKDYLYIEKMSALSEIYNKYQEALYKEAVFDFNDMIIYVRDELEKNNTLRAEVEEEYQYIMIDEFQDTNGAQLSLVKSITSAEHLDGHANVFVVGDDDQSVYKFQGADLNNIFDFENYYKDVKTIVLTENYRSSQKILDLSKEIINNGKNRLENKHTHLEKKLFAKNKELEKKESKIYIKDFNNQEEEYAFVSQEIKNIITEKNIQPKEIAIISRNHNELKTIQTYLDEAGVFYNYERKESVFDQIHIRELITICRYLETVAHNVSEENDELLSTILSFQFLEIDRIDIWNISLEANKKRKIGEEYTWLQIMRESKVEKIKDLADFLIELSIIAKEEPLEIILDILIGSKAQDIVPENEYQDEMDYKSGPKLKSKYISNYKEYYFGKSVAEKDLAKYIHFLSSLKVFVSALREYKKGEMLYVSDLSKFVDLHKNYEVALLNKTTFANNENAVQLLTAHKSKGLEFEYVFLIDANQSTWNKKKGAINKIILPANMGYRRMADDEDDFLRIFFVALTRAKTHIYITHNENKFVFLESIEEEKFDKLNLENNDYNNSILSGLQIYQIPPFADDEKALLQKVVENYKMPVTHLNNFLDISKGGPKLFLEQNLLRFPQSKSTSSIYGSAIHKAIEMMYVLTKQNNKLENVEYFIEIFNKEIKKGRLLKKDEKDLMDKGVEKINNFYELNKNKILEMSKYSKLEVDFKDQNVVLESNLGNEYKDAMLSGKIDRMEEKEKDEVLVIDLKSGKAIEKWKRNKTKEEDEDYDNIKKINYKNQLMFYKILLENSRDYRNKKVNQGILSFVDDGKGEELVLDFNNPEDFTFEEYQDFKKLVIIVYNKIINLDFANIDIAKYSGNSDGIDEFKRDLLNKG